MKILVKKLSFQCSICNHTEFLQIIDTASVETLTHVYFYEHSGKHSITYGTQKILNEDKIYYICERCRTPLVDSRDESLIIDYRILVEALHGGFIKCQRT